MAASEPEVDEVDRILGIASDIEAESDAAAGPKANASDGEPDVALGSQGRKVVKKLLQVSRNALGSKVTVLPAEKYQRKENLKDPDWPYKGWSIILRTVISFEGKIEETRLEIHSERLCEVIKELSRPFWREVNHVVRPIIFNAPYKTLFFIRKLLEDHLSSSSLAPEAKEEIATLLDFINSPDGLKGLLKQYVDQINKGQISFGLLWALFPPGTVVYFVDDDKEECAVVESAEYEEDGAALNLRLVQAYHTGEYFGMVNKHRTIRAFLNWARITTKNLKVIPLDRLPPEKETQVRRRLYARGERYLDMQATEFSHRAYSGPFWTLGAGNRNHFQINGRVVVDSVSLARRQLRVPPELVADSLAEHFHEPKRKREGKKRERRTLRVRQRRFYGDDDSEASGDENFLLSGGQVGPLEDIAVQTGRPEVAEERYVTDAELLICPSDIDCFFLEERQWGSVLVQQLESINWNETAFDRLQMPQFEKDAIEALVKGFDPQRVVDFDDVIQPKGRGLIFLLHGDPGLGKTFTVESIAEQARRPLYHIETSQLSGDNTKFEQELKTIFELGSRWNAVLLLEGADVIMDWRHNHVFLRLIEGYCGLLFFTTNQVERFDSAFMNRIHINIQYPELDSSSSSAIWQNLLSKSSLNRSGVLSDNVIQTLGKLKQNGREIRNIIRVAHSLKEGGLPDSEKASTSLKSVEAILAAIRITSSHKPVYQKAEIDHTARKAASTANV